MNTSDLAELYRRRFDGKLRGLRRNLFNAASQFTPELQDLAKQIIETGSRGPDGVSFGIPLTVDGDAIDRRNVFPSAGPFRSAVTAHSALHLVAEMSPWSALHPDKNDVSSYVMISVSARHPLLDTRQTPNPDDAAALVLALVGDTWGQNLYDLGHLSRTPTSATHYFQLFINPAGAAIAVPAYDHDLPRTKVTIQNR